MPRGFDRCRRLGGRIRTIKPNAETYIPICYLGKKAYRGEVHKVKKKDGGTAAAIKAMGEK